MAQQDVQIQEQAEAFGEARANQEERNARIESEMEERFAEIGDEARQADQS
jgi:hypothetical protein